MSLVLPPLRGLANRKLPYVSSDMIRTYADKEHGAGVVRHDGMAWLRVRIDMPDSFFGNPIDGWIDGQGRRIRLQWSTNLLSWAYGHVQAVPVPDVVTDGWRTTYAESIHPQNAQELTVDNVIRWKRPAGPNIYAWQYDQSIQLLRLAGVTLSLPNNPYAIPEDASLLQSDLRDAGFAGAEVELNPLQEWWEIRAYDLPSDNYNHGPGGIVYPGYQYINMYGEIADNFVLQGTYPNPRFGPGLEPFIIYDKQFIRAKITSF